MMKGRPRRTKGEGSIWKRRDGRYGASAVVLVNGRKKRRQITKNTAEEVQAELRKLQKTGKAPSGKGTFGEFLDEWLEEVRATVRPATYESYEGCVRLRLKPSCGSVRLSRLEPKHINAAVARARVDKLSSSYQAYVRTVARIALNRAQELGRVTGNAASEAAPVRVEQKEIEPFTDEEFARFIEAIKGDRFEAAYLIAVTVGARRGEILGLRWSDIVVREDGAWTIRLARQVQRRITGVDSSGKPVRSLVVAPLKTKRSRRANVLPVEVAEVLERRRREQLEDRLKAGARWENNGHIFTTRLGTVVEPRNLLTYFQNILESAKIPRRPFHALRHETATAQLAAGTPLKAISAMLGHSSERFTSERYAHLVPELEAKVTSAASARLAQARKARGE